MTRPIVLKLKVIPNAPRNEWVGEMADGTVKIKIAAAPEKGKANAAIQSFLAERFHVPKRQVTIMSGETGRIKHVKIDGLKII